MKQYTTITINGKHHKVVKDETGTWISGMPMNAFIDWLKKNDPVGYMDTVKLGIGVTDGSINTPSVAMKEYKQEREN